MAGGVGWVAASLVQELASQAGRFRLGPGEREDTDMGPVIREERRKELIGYIEQGEEVGAPLVADGRGVGPSDGFFLGPTIFDRVTPDMELWRDEMFGPILSVVRASDIDEAINVMNASRYGNAASISTSSGANARAVKRRAEACMVRV